MMNRRTILALAPLAALLAGACAQRPDADLEVRARRWSSERPRSSRRRCK